MQELTRHHQNNTSVTYLHDFLFRNLNFLFFLVSGRILFPRALILPGVLNQHIYIFYIVCKTL